MVLRDTPENPVFTVIPYNNYYEQINHANKIEEILIELGVKVVSRPTIKEIIKKQTLEADRKALDINELLFSGKAAEAIVIESYFSYDEMDADYIIFSDVLSKRVKIIKRDSREILATFQIKDNQPYEEQKENYFKNVLRDALKSLGINVKELPTQQKK
ncbi:MAG: hypothetical protein N2748_00095 [candidate division WOR-3 bacterium]|nr:hypothetical protein [candidate division WOR-3 bacterium]